MEDINGIFARGLEEIIKICRENKVSKFKHDKLEIEFSPLALAVQMSDDQIETEVSKFRKVATDVEKDYERTLFHSVV